MAGGGLVGVSQGGHLAKGPGSRQKINPSSAEVRGCAPETASWGCSSSAPVSGSTAGLGTGRADVPADACVLVTSRGRRARSP